MKVILKQDVKGSGKAGQVVNVSDGYANNFLLKKGLAVPATDQALGELKSKEAAAEHKANVQLEACRDDAKKIDGKTVEISAKAGQSGKLFGSVTSREIAQAIKEKFSIDVDKRKITMDSDIKMFGSYEVGVKLHTKVSAKVTVSVLEG